MKHDEKKIKEIEQVCWEHLPDDITSEKVAKWFLTQVKPHIVNAMKQYAEHMVQEYKKRLTKEVNYYRETPRVRTDFCEWCDDVCLHGSICTCKTEVVRQDLIDGIINDINNE